MDSCEARWILQIICQLEADAEGVGRHPRRRQTRCRRTVDRNHAVGEDAVLVHHVFKDPDAQVHYFSTAARRHMPALTEVTKPQLHLIRGLSIPSPVREALLAKSVSFLDT